MGRQIQRVPLDFDWPLEKTWEGFLLPKELRERECETCGGRGTTTARRWAEATVMALHAASVLLMRAICAACPVIAPCLEEALRHDEHGFWGGLTEAERAQIRGRKARVGNKAASPALEQAMAEAREARRGRGRVE